MNYSSFSILVLYLAISHSNAYSRSPAVDLAINHTLISDRRSGSFIVVNVDAIVSQYERWSELMPRVRPFYAIKANPLPIIVEVMATLGSGFDCASQVSDCPL